MLLSDAGNTGVVILAAGESARLGRAKQSLLFRGKTLLQHAADEAAAARVGDVAVVWGAHPINPYDNKFPAAVQFVQNTKWKEGMAGSLKLGLNTLLSQKAALSFVIVMLCDQPFVSAALLRLLVAQYNATGKEIVASFYNGMAGVPALFARSYFEKLLALEGAEGARKIIKQQPDAVAVVPFSMGKIDIDTEQDYEQLLNRIASM